MSDAKGPVREFAPAKINLFLHVCGRRADGYHDIDSLVVFGELSDEVVVSVSDTFRIDLDGPFASVLAGTAKRDNLALRAARAASLAEGSGRALAVRLTKNLPVAAGLGGGSADAAAVLRAAGRLLRLPRATLLELAEGLGADVPVCLLGRSARVTGTGTVLDPLDAIPRVPLLLCCPPNAVSAGDAYNLWAPSGDVLVPFSVKVPLPDAQVLAALLRGTRNDLSPPAQRLAPDIANVLTALASMPGCLLARQSGSGPCCFALFPTGTDAGAAAVQLSERHPTWWTCVTRLATASVSA